jgi:PBP1b-binding outer membrane lipoprotein LpoB
MNRMKKIALSLTAILLLCGCNTYAQVKNVRKAKARLNAATVLFAPYHLLPAGTAPEKSKILLRKLAT